MGKGELIMTLFLKKLMISTVIFIIAVGWIFLLWKFLDFLSTLDFVNSKNVFILSIGLTGFGLIYMTVDHFMENQAMKKIKEKRIKKE